MIFAVFNKIFKALVNNTSIIVHKNLKLSLKYLISIANNVDICYNVISHILEKII